MVVRKRWSQIKGKPPKFCKQAEPALVLQICPSTDSNAASLRGWRLRGHDVARSIVPFSEHQQLLCLQTCATTARDLLPKNAFLFY